MIVILCAVEGPATGARYMFNVYDVQSYQLTYLSMNIETLAVHRLNQRFVFSTAKLAKNILFGTKTTYFFRFFVLNFLNLVIIGISRKM